VSSELFGVTDVDIRIRKVSITGMWYIMNNNNNNNNNNDNVSFLSMSKSKGI